MLLAWLGVVPVAASSRSASFTSADHGPTDRQETAMLSPNPGTPLDNKLLSSLPRDQIKLLTPHMTTMQLPQGTVLLEAGEEFDHVYFPHSGMLSLLVVMRDGGAIETATVGREGVVGAMAGLGLYKSSVRVVVQLPMAVTKIAASLFRKAVDHSDAVRDLCIRYNEVLLQQARVTAACNAVHPVEARFCRWLLQSADRAESDTVHLTQEFLSEMLGVRRTSVTEVASHIQKLRVINYTRGVITIVDRNALESLSCECYLTLRDH
jgi:CRP-like cAMP-binding protein